MLIAAVIAGFAAIVAAVISVWGMLKAHRKQDGVIDLVDIWVTEAEAVLAEPGVDINELSKVVPDRPLFDIALRNSGDRTAFARRMHLQLTESLRVGELERPEILLSPEFPITEPMEIRAYRLGPTGSYAINLPLEEGCYAHTVNQAVGAGDVDRFVVSLVAQEAERGTDFCQVTLSLDYGRTKKAKGRVTSEPMWVLAYGPPSWERPNVIKQRLSQLADDVRARAPEGGENVGVCFDSHIYPIRTDMENYVAVYETKLQILAALLGRCLGHAADGTRIRGWLAELDIALGEVNDLLRHAADLRASGRHPCRRRATSSPC